jgi:hypothetical protein
VSESELRVPTISLPAELVFADGSNLRGNLFLPAASAVHGGPTSPREHLNAAGEFLAFLPDEVSVPVILNKAELLALSFEAAALPADDDPAFFERKVVLECGGRRIEGALSIDAMQGQSRVLDYLNRADRFLPVRDESRDYLVNRLRISRVIEVRDA